MSVMRTFPRLPEEVCYVQDMLQDAGSSGKNPRREKSQLVTNLTPFAVSRNVWLDVVTANSILIMYGQVWYLPLSEGTLKCR